MEIASEIKLNDTLRTIYERRAVRHFQDKEVDKTVILELIEAAKMAPSAMNRQPWHFYILSNPAKIRKISQAIMNESELKLLKPGIKDNGHPVFHPGSFHLKDAGDFFRHEDPIFHGAPVVIFITSELDNEWAKIDIGMCAQNLMLAAKSLGLDTCPVGLAKFVQSTSEYPSLDIPPSEEVQLAILVGYSDEKPVLHERRSNTVRIVNC